MKYLYRTVKTFTLDGMSAILRVKTDGEQLFLNVSPAEPYAAPAGSLSLTAEYGGVIRSLASSPFRETEAVFPYDDEVKSLTLSGASSVYSGVARSVFSWSGSADDPDPTVEYSCPGLRNQSTTTFSWNLSDSSGKSVCPIFMSIEYWSSYGVYDHRSVPITEPGWQHPSSLQYYVPSAVLPGTRVQVTFCYASYRSQSDASEAYTGLAEVVSPIYTVTELHTPYAPHNLTCKRPVQGASLRLSWRPVEYNRLIGYELQRSVNGGDFTMIYSGASTTFTDTVGRDWNSVVYRVRTLASGGNSVFHIGETMIPLRSNVYVGYGGRICPAEGMWLGRGDGITELTPIFSVGS